MKFQLIQGNFSANDAIDILTHMFEIKIKYHENKIDKDMPEEDVKMREKKIKQLQNDLEEVRKFIKQGGEFSNLQAIIDIT
jgi:cob(I)alamin adenosyltransferase